MSRLVIAIALIGVLVGALGGFVWWGLPATRMRAELRDARTSAEQLAGEAGEALAQNQRLQTQLRSVQTQLQGVENDLRHEKAISSRLHLLVSEGKK